MRAIHWIDRNRLEDILSSCHKGEAVVTSYMINNSYEPTPRQEGSLLLFIELMNISIEP